MDRDGGAGRRVRGGVSGSGGGGVSENFPTGGTDQQHHQSAAVNVRERKFSDDKRRVCSSAECKTFLGEANRNRKLSKENRGDKLTEPPRNVETTEKYLQDSYKESFQRHVDNLTNVICQYKEGSAQERGKTEVHIRPDEEETSSQSSAEPLRRLEIKTDGCVYEAVTFAGSDDDEGLIGMNRAGNVNTVADKLQEEAFFEELPEPNPMITFNHVCSEAHTDRVHLTRLQTSSRSPSPMLEVPGAKQCEKMTMRPPL